jgi:hypothetical protein
VTPNVSDVASEHRLNRGVFRAFDQKRRRAATEAVVRTRRDREEVTVKNMRKLFALAMVATLSLTLAFAVAGCGKKAEETPAATETPAAAGADSTMGGMDSTMQDTTMAH